MSTEAELPDSLDPEQEALLVRVMAEDGPQPDPTLLPPAEGRALAARGNLRWNIDHPAMRDIRDVTLRVNPGLASAECRLRVFVPPNAGAGAILFAHGGGFAFGDLVSHERCIRLLAVEAGMAVVAPDYRLAPEHPYPAGLKDVVASLRALQDTPGQLGLAAGPVLVAGDSAGANLVLAALLHEQPHRRPATQGALLFYGVYAADHDTPSHRRFAEGPGLTSAKMQRYWDWYLPDHGARRDPLAAPLHASDLALAALPPLYLMAAGIDPLLSDSHALARRLDVLGRPAPVKVVPGVVHGFLQQTIGLKAARDALAEAGVAARKLAGGLTN